MSVYDKGILRGHFSAEDFLSLLISLYFYQIWLDFLLFTMEYFMGMWISVIGSSLTKMTSAAVYQVRTVSRWRFLISQPPPLSLSYSRSLSLSVSHSTTLICLWMEKEASTRGATSGQHFLPSVYLCAHTLHLLQWMRRHHSDTIWQQPRGTQSILTHDSDSLPTLPLSTRTRLPSSVLCGALDGRQRTE